MDQLRRPRAVRAAARHRLERLARELARLRASTDLSLPELVLEVERALLLDVELAAGAGAPGGTDAVLARAQLDAFTDVAARFHDTSDRPTLGAFLSWLKAAETRERGLEQADDVTGHDADAAVVPDEVQVNRTPCRCSPCTRPRAWSGTSWRCPGLLEERFPAGRTKADQDTASGWLTPIGSLPYELRGDAGSLPSWRWRSVAHVKDAAASVEEHKLACGAHEVDEERRLAYVAVTRARHRLLLSGAWWSTRKKPMKPSRFLVRAVELLAHDPRAELVGRSLLDQVPDGENPLQAEQRVHPWPEPVTAPAARRWRSPPRPSAPPPRPQAQLARVPASPVVAALEDEVDRLLAEREALRRTASEVVLPSHLSASRAVRLARDPAELALALRRPVPTEPRAQTRLGTTFHEWVEHHLRSQALLDLDDVAGAGDADEPPAPGLEPLQDAFLASEWSRREVVDVEVDLETSVGGTVLRGRIDAVVRDDDGPDGRRRYVVVDWKTGAVPTGDDAVAAQVQLAVYRLAWSRLHGVPPQDVRAAFFHVASGRTVWLDDGETDQERLEQVLGSLPTADGEPLERFLADVGVQLAQHADGVVDDRAVLGAHPVHQPAHEGQLAGQPGAVGQVPVRLLEPGDGVRLQHGVERPLVGADGHEGEVVGRVGHLGVAEVEQADHLVVLDQDVRGGEVAVHHGGLEPPPADVLERLLPPREQAARDVPGPRRGVELAHPARAVLVGAVGGQAGVLDHRRRHLVQRGEGATERGGQPGPGPRSPGCSGCPARYG